MEQRNKTIRMLLNRIALTYQDEEPARGATRMLLSKGPDQLVTDKVARRAQERALLDTN